MKVIRNINNNVSLCLDSKNREVIVFGKGVGFTKPPYEIPLKQIERTFYNVNDLYVEAVQNIPKNVMDIAIEIIDEATKQLHINYPSVTVLPLADHINFAIKRKQDNLYMEVAMEESLRQLHPDEWEFAEKSRKFICEETGVNLPKSETAYITLHLVNYEDVKGNDNKDFGEMITHCLEIVEDCYGRKINQNSYNYSRFVTHIDFLLRRTIKNKPIVSNNEQLYESIKVQYPESYECSQRIKEYLYQKRKIDLSKEEQLYLMLHINRLCSREDCYR